MSEHWPAITIVVAALLTAWTLAGYPMPRRRKRRSASACECASCNATRGFE